MTDDLIPSHSGSPVSFEKTIDNTDASMHGVAAERFGRRLLTAALLLAVGLAALDFNAPWGIGIRGENGAMYSEPFVRSLLDHDLAVTHAAPCSVVVREGTTTCYWDWHHPPLYWLYLAAVASVLGVHEWALRLAHLPLFLPGIVALFALVRQASSPVLAGATALLFAAAPLVGYFGPMVIHSGAVMSFGLLSAAMLWRYQAQPTRKGWWCLATLFFVATMLDFLGHFWGVGLMALALVAPDRRRAVVAVLWLVPVSLVSLLVVVLHYGTFMGGPSGFCAAMLHFFTHEHAGDQVTAADVWVAASNVLFDYGSWPLAILAVLGLSFWAVDRGLRRQMRPGQSAGPRAPVPGIAVALAIPAILDCLGAPPHAVSHECWTMQGWSAAALLGALVSVQGIRWLQRRARRWRLAGAGLLTVTVATIVNGVVSVDGLVTRFREVDNGIFAAVAATDDLLEDCVCALTNLPVPTRLYRPGLMFVGGVDKVWVLEQLLDKARAHQLHGNVAVLLTGRQYEPALHERLCELAPAQQRGHVIVFRFRL